MRWFVYDLEEHIFSLEQPKRHLVCCMQLSLTPLMSQLPIFKNSLPNVLLLAFEYVKNAK